MKTKRLYAKPEDTSEVAFGNMTKDDIINRAVYEFCERLQANPLGIYKIHAIEFDEKDLYQPQSVL